MTPINDELAAQLKADAISARRARRAPWQNAHVDRLAREQEARETAREYRQAQREATKSELNEKHCTACRKSLPVASFGVVNGKRRARCSPCHNAANRRLYHQGLGRTGSGVAKGTICPERQRKAKERIAHLTALLMGTDPGERIASDEGWDMATSELQSLWLQSGDKECVSCKVVLPPSAILPPGPANFYPGKCRSCSLAEYRENQLRVFGRPTGPRPIPLRDGSTITVAEFARRCRERGPAYERKTL